MQPVLCQALCESGEAGGPDRWGTVRQGEVAARPAQHAACRGTPLHVTAAAAGLLEAPPAAPPAVQRSMTRSVSTSRVKPAELDAPHVAYEMVQGALVRRSFAYGHASAWAQRRCCSCSTAGSRG